MNSSVIIKARAKPISVVARSKAWACGHSLPRIVGSNPARGDGCLYLGNVVCWQIRSVRRVDHSSRGVVPGAVFSNMVSKCRQGRGLGPTRAIEPWEKMPLRNYIFELLPYYFILYKIITWTQDVYFSEVWPLPYIIVGSLVCIDSIDCVAFVSVSGYKWQNYMTAGQR
jgi:hypothetical protein